MIRNLTVTFLLFFIFDFAWANKCSTTSDLKLSPIVLEKHAKEVVNEGLYKKYFCCDSIYFLAQSLVDKGYNINELSVIYIFNKEYNLEITKEQGRPEDVVGFHVVLLYKGYIIDFDFSSTLFVISKETYFKKMFNELESIYLKTIPAAEYVSEYSSKIGILTKDWNYYLKRSDLRYPPRKLTDFLNTP